MFALRSRTFCALLAGLMFASFVAFAPEAAADKIHLKNGTTLDGVVVRETDVFVQLRVKVGGIESVKTVLRSEISKIEKDAPAPKESPSTAPGESPAPSSAPQTPVAPAPTTDKALQIGKRLDSGGTRIAILNFGAPSSWNGEIGDTVGSEILASSWRSVIPLLEKDNVDVVIVRINSAGGSDEFLRFQDLFHDVYKKKFRTVGWVESAISAAAMAPYTLEEFYFMPNASFGACVGWSGDLQNMEGVQLEIILAKMEEASAKGKRSPAIMRSMQLQDPLSATIDKVSGDVTWFQDTSGEHMINRPGQVLTLTANDAVKFKFARGLAATKEELAAAMGFTEYTWAGEEAARKIDEDMRAADKASKQWELKYREFQLNAGIAEQTQDRADRAKFVGRALNALREMRQLFKGNPGIAANYGLDATWFENTERELRKLLQGR